jgi:uncharacterized MAPEG superfamily protein
MPPNCRFASGKPYARTEWGSQLYFWMRVVYLPLYAVGVPFLRTIVWLASAVGILLVLSAAVSA